MFYLYLIFIFSLYLIIIYNFYKIIVKIKKINTKKLLKTKFKLIKGEKK